MEHSEIINLWKLYDRKLEETLVLNKRNAEDIIRIKVKSQLSSMKPIKLFTLVAGVIWVSIGSLIISNLFIHAYSQASKFFLYSAAIQLILTAIAIVIYIYQLVLIHQVDISEPVLKTQEKLARLKSSTLWVTRILFLQLPVWTTFYISEATVKHGGVVFYIIQGLLTISFTYCATWLFFNIRYENRNKKWFRLIFDGKEWTPVLKSMELLEEIHDYRKEV